MGKLGIHFWFEVVSIIESWLKQIGIGHNCALIIIVNSMNYFVHNYNYISMIQNKYCYLICMFVHYFFFFFLDLVSHSYSFSVHTNIEANCHKLFLS